MRRGSQGLADLKGARRSRCRPRHLVGARAVGLVLVIGLSGALAACSGGSSASRSVSALPSTGGTDPQVGGDRSQAQGDAGSVLDLRALSTAGWIDALGSLDDLTVDKTKPSVADLGPWVTVRQGGAAGYADLRGLMLADLSTDGEPEAVVPLVSGADRLGTAALVFTGGPDGPLVVGDQSFYKSFGFNTRATIESGELALRHSVGAGWEPPCCYSGEVSRRFRTAGLRMVETSPALEVGNVVAKGFTVDRFYALLNARSYEAAFSMLTESERQRTRDSLWPTIWSQGAQINVNILSTPRADGLFPFRLIIADGTGGVLAWQGGAGLIYNTTTHSWYIDLLSLQAE